MDTFERFSHAGIVPVVVIDHAGDALPTARALLDGGVDVMEITFRTDAAAGAIRAVSEGCPEMLVGAGTVITLAQCRQAVEAGARFIVAPGYDEEVVSWCVEKGVPILPGCVTPTEIMAAMKHGLTVLKFFPAGVYGGQRYEGSQRSLQGDQVRAHRRCGSSERRRVRLGAVHSRGRRQLGLRPERHCLPQF